jgi:hypothetical protein
MRLQPVLVLFEALQLLRQAVFLQLQLLVAF